METDEEMAPSRGKVICYRHSDNSEPAGAMEPAWANPEGRAATTQLEVLASDGGKNCSAVAGSLGRTVRRAPLEPRPGYRRTEKTAMSRKHIMERERTPPCHTSSGAAGALPRWPKNLRSPELLYRPASSHGNGSTALPERPLAGH
jgi:hypothetical protein